MKAQAITNSLSVSLNQLPVWIKERSPSEPVRFNQVALFDASSGTSIQPGLIEIRAEVEVLFEYA
ncbi:hypothetical protein NDM98_17080 [Shouchella plakortidis]|uniref:Uncharacterized protein n=1 Tax=Alkalicoccobacillus plakortidis TaxID=444060 RepID=A0ABT0XM64_9BACI|nr:hypothetical protein [Alkalicoccobacillus plakortidis]MCM2676989.1 hypothetical protein [Alkalicoccobacillus plakortidis]